MAVMQVCAQEAFALQIAFEETMFDFDTIWQGDDGEHVFRFTNKGNAPLIVSSAFSSCGCVVPEWPKELVAPRANASIKVKHNTGKNSSCPIYAGFLCWTHGQTRGCQWSFFVRLF